MPSSRRPHVHSLGAAVTEVIIRRGVPRVTVASVAAEIGISVRMMQTALAEEKTNFRALRRLSMVRAAMTLLTATDMSIPEIARRTGYTNQANFHRAFMAITGMTPNCFRGRSGR